MPTPYVAAESATRDFSLKAVVFGVLFGAIFGSANAYLGLKVGLTISTAIPLAVISVALFKFLQPVLGPSSILECNITQTAGSSSSSLASGVIFTIPALFMWGFAPSLLQMSLLAALGGVLGILFMIPLRRFLIVREHATLPYPEGTAAAQVLIAADQGGATARAVFTGLGIGAIYKAFLSFLRVIPDAVAIRLPVIPKAVVELETMPALLGVGYILNYRVSAIMVAGGLLSWLVLIPVIAWFGAGSQVPLFPETVQVISDMSASALWSRYVRYIGAGAVAAAGILTVIKSVPTMYDSLRVGLAGLRGGTGQERAAGTARTDRDLPMTVVFGGVALVIAVLTLLPNVIGVHTNLGMRAVAAVCIAVFAFMFVTVSSRIVGLIGVSSNPTSGMTIVTLLGVSLVFSLLGWTDDFGKATAVTIGTVVCVAASIAGDISQDLKSGFLLGATPARQQTAELLGAVFSAAFVCLAVWVLGETFTFGSEALPAPQATLMKTVVDGVLSANLPWGLVLTGAAIAIVVELLGLPSLPFAVGVYLPLSAMTPVFLGGVVRHIVERSKKTAREASADGDAREQGILLSSGLIAGEGIMGVALAVFAFVSGTKPTGIGMALEGIPGQIASFGLFLLLAAYLYRVGRR